MCLFGRACTDVSGIVRRLAAYLFFLIAAGILPWAASASIALSSSLSASLLPSCCVTARGEVVHERLQWRRNVQVVSSTVRNTNAPHQVDAARVDCLCQGGLCFEFSLLDHIAQLFDGICLVGLLGRHQLVRLLMGPRPLRIWVPMTTDKFI